MKFNWLKGIGLGVLLWILIFVGVSVLMFTPFLQGMLQVQQILYWIFLAFFILISTWLYFKDAKKYTWKDGLYLALVFLGVATLLDIAITVPLFVKSYVTFFLDWQLYVGYAEVLVLTPLIAYCMGKKKPKKRKKR